MTALPIILVIGIAIAIPVAVLWYLLEVAVLAYNHFRSHK